MKKLHTLLQPLMHAHPLRIADVGSTGGAELRWKPWRDLCHFYTFDPDPRASVWSGRCENFKTGLWSTQGTKTLKLTRYPQATSLLTPIHEQLKPFQQAYCFEEVGKEEVSVDALDHILDGRKVDFLKIDAEGSELEIIEGAQQAFEHCLGVQLEAYFYSIREGAPTFTDLDQKMRAFGFQLFHLKREHWIRKNNVYLAESSPQLIWGDALYLLPKAQLHKRDCEKTYARYLLLLLAYGLHDYACEICEELSYDWAKKIAFELKHLPNKGVKEAVFLMFSIAMGSLKVFFASNKDKRRHRICHLRRKGIELGNLCLYLSRGHATIADL